MIDETLSAIEQLRQSNTYTVVTAHQPSLFSGPLYVVYKLLSAIRTAQAIADEYPDIHVQPVFVVGGEDHDFEEINHVRLFHQLIRWEQTKGGAVGSLSTEDIQPLLQEVKDTLGDRPMPKKLYELLAESHHPSYSYGQAFQAMLHRWFGHRGILVLRMNDARLKKAFSPIIKKEVFEQPSHDLILSAGKQLQNRGYDLQATPREINFFYLEEGMRNRIVRTDNGFAIHDTELHFTEAEMQDLIEQHPERFSPNVVMRPLYQETVLPNLAYIGGGGELAYWLERRTQFEHFDMKMPALLRRHSAIWIDKSSAKKMDKLGLSISDLLQDEERCVQAYVKQQATTELSLSPHKKEIAKVFEQIVAVAKEVDQSLVKKVKAEMVANMNSLGQLESRLLKAEKQHQEIAVKQIRSLYERLFPERGLQERYRSFLDIYAQHGEAAVDVLLAAFEPFKHEMVVVRE